MLRDSKRSIQPSHHISDECARPHLSATRNNAPLLHEGLPRPLVARKPEDFSRAKPAHQLLMRNRLTFARAIRRPTLVQDFLVACRHWHLIFVGDGKPQALSDFETLPFGQSKEGRDRFRSHVWN